MCKKKLRELFTSFSFVLVLKTFFFFIVNVERRISYVYVFTWTNLIKYWKKKIQKKREFIDFYLSKNKI